MSCCPVTALPAVAGDASAIVSFTTEHNNITLYVAAPPAGTVAKVGLLAFSDIFGLDSGRIKQDADNLAKLGYAVAVVDMTNGEYNSPEDLPGVIAWCIKHSFANVLSPAIQDAIAYLQSEYKSESFVSYGYCWGGWVGAYLSALPTPVIKGHVSFHPSWRIENMIFGDGAVEKLTERINVPQLLLSASDEPPYMHEDGSVIKILSDKPETSAHSNVVDFPDVFHGFVNRGEVEEREVEVAVKKAWAIALKFIQTVAAQ